MTWALRTALDLDAVNVHLAALEDAGLLGVVEESGAATVYLSSRRALPIDGTWERVPDRDWNEVWKAGIAPVTVGGVTIVPPWLQAPAGSREVLVVEPAQAFGTGHHETTTGCLAALQELDLTGRSVLDVGTGTGVLAIAAARLGASPVVGVDVDPLAVAAARSNASVNGVVVEVLEGSADAVADRFAVVLANLDTATLSSVATDLAARLHRGGHLIASGVSIDRQGEAVSALEAAGLSVTARAGREWVVLLGVPAT